MPNPKILSDLLKAAGKLPKGSKAAQEAVSAEMAAREAAQRAAYAGHTPPTETGQSSLSTIRDILESQEFPVRKMAAGGRTGLITEALKAAKAALKGEAHTAARGTEAASILTKQAKEVPPPLPRAKPKTKQELSEMAERIAPQLQGEFVRGAKGTTSVAGKSRKQFDLEQQLEHDLRRSREVPEAQPIDLAERKGSVMLSLPGDFTIADQDLYRVGDVTLREPSRQYGGPRFGLGHPEEAGWASGLSAAGKFQRGVTEASQQYGDVPVLANYMMMGPEGINYALHFADANLKAIDATKMTKKNIRDFNSLIKRGHPKLKFPEFAGIENPDLAYEQMAADPELRKHFNSIMQMPTIAESFKMPAGLNIRHAVTEPELRDLERGMTGFSVMEMEPGVASLNVSKHPTYSHDIPGKFLGKTEVMMPYELTFPDAVAQIRANPRQAPYEFGTLQFGGGRQIIDQQLIDEIGEYTRRIKELTGKKNGGLAMADGGQAFPLQEDFQTEMERRRARPRTRAGVPVEDTNVLGGALQGLGETLVGGGRGALATMLGAPADILNLLNVKQFGTPDIPYGSEFFKESLPLAPTTQTGKTAQQLGEFLPINPEQPVQAGVAGARKAGKALAPTMADMLEAQLQKTGMMMPIAPEGKAAKIKAPANDLGFYNPAEKAALNLQRKKGTGDAFLADMKKQPGVNDKRITELGLDQFRGKPSVTREEIIAATEERRIPLQESVKRERDEARIEQLESEYDDLLDGHSEASVTGDLRAKERFEREMADNLEEQKALKSVEEARFGPSSQPEYSMPGGENYREIRVALPENKAELPSMEGFTIETIRENKYTGQRDILIKGPQGNIVSNRYGFRGDDAAALRDEAASRARDASKEDNFYHRTHHGDEPNVLFHLRVADHTDVDGKRGLLIDELQSDWHQAGREKGYKNIEEQKASDAALEEAKQYSQQLREKYGGANVVSTMATVEEQNKYRDLFAKAQQLKPKSQIPDAPFKDNWYQLGLKRAIKEAADTGMDRVYLTTGARQADRYDLSKQVDEVIYSDQGVLYARGKDGETIINQKVPQDKLADYIGKEAAEKLIKTKEDVVGSKVLSGVDLKVGGEGMKQWYDKTYKNYLEKYAKQHNSKLGTTTIADGEPVYYIDITDAMRETAKKGQSYAEGGAVHPAVEKFAASLPHPAVTEFENRVIDLGDMITGGSAVDLSNLVAGSFANGGAVYNTIPDVSDAEKMVQGPAF